MVMACVFDPLLPDDSEIETVAREGDGSLIPEDWKRYRDETFDINTNCTGEMIENFAKYLNKTVLPRQIKFGPEYSEKYLDFLDVRVHLREGYLIPRNSFETNKLA